MYMKVVDANDKKKLIVVALNCEAAALLLYV